MSENNSIWNNDNQGVIWTFLKLFTGANLQETYKDSFCVWVLHDTLKTGVNEARFILPASAKWISVTQQLVRAPFPFCDAVKFTSHEALAGSMNL